MNHQKLLGVLIIASLMLAGVAAWAQEEEEKVETEKRNLNVATLEELQELPGMTDEIAQAIIEHRPYESFLNVVELEEVSEEFLISIEDIAEVKRLNINTATSEELQRLPGITPELADAIIASGPYEITEELFKVKGIGEEEISNLFGYIAAAPEEPGDKGWKRRNVLLPGELPQP